MFSKVSTVEGGLVDIAIAGWGLGDRGCFPSEGRLDGAILILTWASEKKMYLLQWIMKASISSPSFSSSGRLEF